jgi:hypothetical protein
MALLAVVPANQCCNDDRNRRSKANHKHSWLFLLREMYLLIGDRHTVEEAVAKSDSSVIPFAWRFKLN